MAGLLLGRDGNFYGTTVNGGANLRNNGTVFKITPSGVLTTLHSFDGEDGANPSGGLFQAANGTLYGTTFIGGAATECEGGCGTVFSLDVGPAPFVETVPTSAEVGQRVLILGANLTGATRVKFAGTPALFKVVSHSLITTAVPAGATTGKVEVATHQGILTSKVNFRVTP